MTRQSDEIDALWCCMFGGPPPIVADSSLVLGVLIRCMPQPPPYVAMARSVGEPQVGADSITNLAASTAIKGPLLAEAARQKIAGRSNVGRLLSKSAPMATAAFRPETVIRSGLRRGRSLPAGWHLWPEQ